MSFTKKNTNHFLEIDSVLLTKFFIGILFSINLYFLFLDGNLWFSPEGVLFYGTKNPVAFSFLSLFYWIKPTVIFLNLVFGAIAIFLVLWIFNFYTSISSFILFVLYHSLIELNPYITSSGDGLFKLVFFLYSFYFLDQGKTTKVLFRVLLSWVYLCTFLWKIQGESWQTGWALGYVFEIHQLMRFDVPELFMTPVMIKILTYSTLVLELALGTLIWIKKLRKPLLVLGFIFHLSIEILFRIHFFEWLMMFSLLIWLDNIALKRTLFSFRKQI